jgi:hypothetical protein
MIFPPVALYLQAALCLVASAATNLSVDDQNPLFQYTGSWQRIIGNLDKGGGHMLTYTAGSSATITYTCASLLNEELNVPNRSLSILLLLFSSILHDREVGGLNELIFAVASVYFLSPLWPYPVSTDYGIDGNPPSTTDMQDHSVPATAGGNATVASNVVASWTGTANQEHTILVTIPAGGDYAVVDMFM